MESAGRLAAPAFSCVPGYCHEPDGISAFNDRVLSGIRTAHSLSRLTLRVNSDLVVLEAGVTDPRGANVPDLKLADFRVYEDGRLQTIRQFSAEERPATIALVVDNSGSMRPNVPRSSPRRSA